MSTYLRVQSLSLRTDRRRLRHDLRDPERVRMLWVEYLSSIPSFVYSIISHHVVKLSTHILIKCMIWATPYVDSYWTEAWVGVLYVYMQTLQSTLSVIAACIGQLRLVILLYCLTCISLRLGLNVAINLNPLTYCYSRYIHSLLDRYAKPQCRQKSYNEARSRMVKTGIFTPNMGTHSIHYY